MGSTPVSPWAEPLECRGDSLRSVFRLWLRERSLYSWDPSSSLTLWGAIPKALLSALPEWSEEPGAKLGASGRGR